jgi:hypothetical protein
MPVETASEDELAVVEAEVTAVGAEVVVVGATGEQPGFVLELDPPPLVTITTEDDGAETEDDGAETEVTLADVVGSTLIETGGDDEVAPIEVGLVVTVEALVVSRLLVTEGMAYGGSKRPILPQAPQGDAQAWTLVGAARMGSHGPPAIEVTRADSSTVRGQLVPKSLRVSCCIAPESGTNVETSSKSSAKTAFVEAGP